MLYRLKITVICACLAFFASFSFLSTASELKDSAPDVYVVKKGDTLWRIAGMYLDKPWNWPLLWQNNSDIQNPHLIYPGDRILLQRSATGEATLTLVRANKTVKKLSPEARVQLKADAPLPTLDWSEIAPHFQYDMILDEGTYEVLPYLLGNQQGELRFASGDVVLGKQQQNNGTKYHVIRRIGELFDKNEESLGLLVKQVAVAEKTPVDLTNQVLVNVIESRSEAKGGDRLLLLDQPVMYESLELKPASDQIGTIVGSLQNRSMLGKYDIAIIDLSSTDVSPGTVMGIYSRGPDIVDDQPVRYLENDSGTTGFIFNDENVQQPALKVGEMLVIKTFAKASFGLIISSTEVIKNGAYVGRP